MAFTGFGKTRIGLNAIVRLRRNDKTRKVIICVPGEPLKEQWEKVLNSGGQMANTRIFIINTLAKLSLPIDCHLLIVDEDHRAAADTFKRVFEVVRYKWALGLTPRAKRLDGKEKIVLKYLPVCDTIPIQEGRKYGWTSPFREYNLGLEMEPEEREKYNYWEKEYTKMVGKFNNDFGLMKDCSTTINPYMVEQDGMTLYLAPSVVKQARKYGWKGNSARVAMDIKESNDRRPRGERKTNMWGGDMNHPYHPDKLRGFAIHGMTMMRSITQFIYSYERKIDACEALIRGLERKTITFAERQASADQLAERLGDEAVVYHTKIAKREGRSQKNTKRDVLDDILEGRKRILLAAKAVDEGFDWPEAEFGVILSRTSNPLQQIQRRGRLTRKHTFADGKEKEAVLVNIYIKDTRDVKWLSAAQEQGKGMLISWVDSVDEILEMESEVAEGV